MINFNDNSFISNTYSATGEKLSTAYGIRMAPVLSPLSSGETAVLSTRDGGISGGGSGTPEPQAGQFRHYCGNVVYDMGVTRLLTGEGYVTFASDGTPQYHYYLRDHLGNVRVVMDQSGSVEQVNHYYAFGGLMRESTNPGVQPYKYGGKELDRTSGLDAYDFGARSYFADRLQWGTMDPLCEKYYDVTPYGYCDDDPVNAIDPDGNKIVVWLFKKNEHGNSVAAKNFSNTIFKKAMGIFAQTTYGRNLISSFTPSDKYHYGVKGNGKYANYEMEIQVGGYSNITDKTTSVKSTEGCFDIDNDKGRLKFIFYINTTGRNLGEILETIDHEFGLHGSSIERLIKVYEMANKEGKNGFKEAQKLYNSDIGGHKDHNNLSKRNKNDMASRTYLEIMDEILDMEPSFEKEFYQGLTNNSYN